MTDPLETTTQRLSFAQREGVEPLPSQLALREVSQELRAKSWNCVFTNMKTCVEHPTMGGPSYFKGYWRDLLYAWHVDHCHLFADEFNNRADKQVAKIKTIFQVGSYIKLFSFIEYLATSLPAYHTLVKNLTSALRECRAAYMLVDAAVVPVASEQDALAIAQTFEALNAGKFTGARSHLKSAGQELTTGNFASSVREAIHAVESASRVLAPGANALAPALSALEKSGTIHGGLKAGFGSLYGFTSDEEGIRHALLEQGDANVSEADALYMFGACAAFLTYLAVRTATVSS